MAYVDGAGSTEIIGGFNMTGALISFQERTAGCLAFHARAKAERWNSCGVRYLGYWSEYFIALLIAPRGGLQ
jgi:hypothetical protein